MNKGAAVKWADPQNEEEKAARFILLENTDTLSPADSVRIEEVAPGWMFPPVRTVALRHVVLAC